LIDCWKGNLEFAFIFSLLKIVLIAGHEDIERLVKTKFGIFCLSLFILIFVHFYHDGIWGHLLIGFFYGK
jgi:hypothetical protein